jgi:hypothetical protein
LIIGEVEVRARERERVVPVQAALVDYCRAELPSCANDSDTHAQRRWAEP